MLYKYDRDVTVKSIEMPPDSPKDSHLEVKGENSDYDFSVSITVMWHPYRYLTKGKLGVAFILPPADRGKEHDDMAPIAVEANNLKEVVECIVDHYLRRGDERAIHFGFLRVGEYFTNNGGLFIRAPFTIGGEDYHAVDMKENGDRVLVNFDADHVVQLYKEPCQPAVEKVTAHGHNVLVEQQGRCGNSHCNTCYPDLADQ